MAQITILTNPIRIFLFICIIVALLTVLCDGRSRKRGGTHRIIGGYELQTGDFPEFISMVKITRDYDVFCGGVLIEKDVVLTGALCVDGYESLLAAPGNYHPKAWKENKIIPYRAVKTCVSDKYSRRKLIYDIGVVILEEPVEDGKIAALETKTIEPGQKGIAVGIGYVKYFGKGEGEFPKRAFAIPMESIECDQKNKHESHACFSSYDPKFIGDVCYGDSGGPVFSAVDNSTVLGLASYGNLEELCLVKKAKSVFVDVPNMKKEIEELVRECRS